MSRKLAKELKIFVEQDGEHEHINEHMVKALRIGYSIGLDPKQLIDGHLMVGSCGVCSAIYRANLLEPALELVSSTAQDTSVDDSDFRAQLIAANPEPKGGRFGIKEKKCKQE